MTIEEYMKEVKAFIIYRLLDSISSYINDNSIMYTYQKNDYMRNPRIEQYYGMMDYYGISSDEFYKYKYGFYSSSCKQFISEVINKCTFINEKLSNIRDLGIYITNDYSEYFEESKRMMYDDCDNNKEVIIEDLSKKTDGLLRSDICNVRYGYAMNKDIYYPYILIYFTDKDRDMKYLGDRFKYMNSSDIIKKFNL